MISIAVLISEGDIWHILVTLGDALIGVMHVRLVKAVRSAFINTSHRCGLSRHWSLDWGIHEQLGVQISVIMGETDGIIACGLRARWNALSFPDTVDYHEVSACALVTAIFIEWCAVENRRCEESG